MEAGYTCRVEQNEKYKVIKEDFIDYKTEQKFDLVWTSHVLEHQLNVEDFIKKLFDCCSDNGKVAITVPDEVTGKVIEGHVHFWNAGLLMYNIIKCGYSCRNAAVKTYAGNVSVNCTKRKNYI